MTVMLKGKSNNGAFGKRAIAIVGAGQASLQLGCGFLQKGYTVTLLNNAVEHEDEREILIK